MASVVRRLGALGLMALVCACGQEGQGTAGAAATGGALDAGPDAGVAAAPEHPGKATYERYCFNCHAAGTAGAPLLGVKEDWLGRIDRGVDDLVRTTIEGIPPAMPPRGLCMRCDDATLRQAVEYMVEAAR